MSGMLGYVNALTVDLPEDNVTQFGIVYEFRVNPGTVDGLWRGLHNRFDLLPAIAGGKNVGQQQGCALILTITKYIEEQGQALAYKLHTVVVWTDLKKVLQELVYHALQA